MVAFAYKPDQWMPCYCPIRAYFGKSVSPNTGRRPIVFNISQSFSGIPIDVPCGQCIGCKLERSRQWALRIVHEKRLHAESAFLTLTYADANLPANGSLDLRHLQLFMKRLRKRREQGLRFFACGEYGELTGRPHYHILLMNASFPDMKFYKTSGQHNLSVSVECSKIWSFGDHFIGDVTFESAAYVARYCVKKISGPGAAAHYGGRVPEFVCMSRRPGIGAGWFEKYYGEAYHRDSAIANAREVRLPRYYDTKYEKLDGERLERLKRERKRKAAALKGDNGIDRRRVKERFTELKLARFAREK